MEHIRLRGQIDISLIRSHSENAKFNYPAQTTLGRFSTVRVIPINDSSCCSSLSRLQSCLQFFKLHLYNNHKLAIAVGAIAIGLGVAALIFSFGISSVISWCLITGGATLIGGTLYHSASVALNCGLCRRAHAVEDSDSELEASH